MRSLVSSDPDYPRRLLELPSPPEIHCTGDLARRGLGIAIVGSREAHPESLALAGTLAAACATAGATILSGGALGIDSAAHRGALGVGGRTWAVLPCGAGHFVPEENAELFRQIRATDGALIWPFPRSFERVRGNFYRRNAVLMALADIVVVVQAGEPSGAFHAGTVAKKNRLPLWVVPTWPDTRGFEGSNVLLHLGAIPLTSLAYFMKEIGYLNAPAARQLPLLGPDENLVYETLAFAPKHRDEIIVASGLPVPQAATALLTLALGDVVVEGPDGFFRRTIL